VTSHNSVISNITTEVDNFFITSQ